MIALSDAFVQILILGGIALTCPGLFNALSGLGAAGSNDPKYANQANCALYACFAVFGYFGGVFFNLMGNRILLCAGGLTYCLYALGMYLASNVDGADWVSILVGCLLGVGAGLFWTAQGAMMMSYSTPFNKGNYIGWFWIIFNLGGMLGGILQFAVNYNAKDDSTQANKASYFLFIAIMAIGAVVVPFVIVKADKVKKADGSLVSFDKGTSVKDEILGALKASMNKYMLLLLPFFVASNWFYTYQFNYVNGTLFNIRTRGLNSAFYWASQMLSAWLIGLLLDMDRFTRRQRALVGWLFTFVCFALAWSFGTYVQYGLEKGYDKDRVILEHIDFKQSKRAWCPILTYIFYGIADAALQAFAYWLMGAIAGNNTQLSARFAGFYKGIQSAGAAVAWGLDLNSGITYRDQYWVGFAMWALGSFLAYIAVRFVKNESEETLPAAPVLQKTVSAPLSGPSTEAIKHSTSMKEQELNKAMQRATSANANAAMGASRRKAQATHI
ncbi:putative major facilitator family transporter [Gregarina niphandrodes]|uniref:Major facilitator family transporter n=1 Tax=Gregarina niphandrodes TaxID=110365 RepID=A0A023B5N7_GRENI|nr:putative major facilitator family transporter [Gregarina niphandrodes]EZG61407.1 putative major facilitator family transporter [Gregarina niphandrodes]|eukprot:XP_011130767.1 putative major facilitator family transporter [Gregarina niphandrodes]